MEIDYKAIGQRIKIARIKKGITQEAVADLIDISSRPYRYYTSSHE